MDRYEIGFEIAKTVANSNEPLEEIKYLTRILRQLFDVYIDREKIRYYVINKNLWNTTDTKTSTQ